MKRSSESGETPARAHLATALWFPLAAVIALLLALAVLFMEPEPGGRDLAAGERLYLRHCASCHGADLEGQPDWRRRNADGRLPAPPHDDTGHTWHHDDQLLFEIVKYGLVPPRAPEGYRSDMPAYDGVLSDAEIRDILAYIASRWSDETRERRAQRLGR